MTDTPARRRRGAQPGNNNARKKPFYAEILSSADQADWDVYNFSGLKEEAQMLRFVIRRAVELSQANQDFEQAVSLLRAVSLALMSLTRLVTADRDLAPAMPEMLQSALDRVVEEMKRKRAAAFAAQSPTPISSDSSQNPIPPSS